MESSSLTTFIKPLKTYVNTRKSTPKTHPKSQHAVKSDEDYLKLLKREPLSTKKAAELLVEGTLKAKVCRFCLNVAFPLSELDQYLSVAGRGAMYEVTIRDMVATFHPFKVVDDQNFPNKICNKCLNQAIRSYLFAQQCEQAERALRNCFEEMFEKLEKLDPLERVKKRGRQKLNPNHNILHVEHQNVIEYAEPIRNLINSGSVSFTKEPKMTDLECKKCWQVLPNVESLLNHENMHPKTMWFHCRECGKSFAKRNQIKNHMRVHDPNKEIALPVKNSFECKQCGFISDNHIVHLQHIEKHKYHMVLEHLVERNMETLCAVCLEKGKLVGLDKIICLHGGYPQLTGEKSLQNILGSTIPEKNSYKYQELLVPHNAKVLTIAKRADVNISTINKQNLRVIDIKTNTFIKKTIEISHPIIVSNEIIFSDDLYLFDFAEPLRFHEQNIIDKKVNNSNKLINNFEELKDNAIIEPNQDRFEGYGINSDDAHETSSGNRIIFNFSLPNYVLNGENSVRSVLIESDDTNDQNEAKPSCEKGTKILRCKENIIDNFIQTDDVVNNETVTKTDKCKFCWIFKNAEKCHYCKNSHKENVKNQIININIVDIEQNVTSKDKKRKIINKNTDIKTKKSKWQCLVCLTNNNCNRETCHCCDSEMQNDLPAKIKFSFNKNIFLDHLERSSPKLNIDDDQKCSKNEDEKVSCETMECENTQINSNNVVEEIVIKMPEYNNNCGQTDEDEIMDVEEDNELNYLTSKPQIHIPNFAIHPILPFNAIPNSSTTNIGIPSFQSTSFQFNIGSSPLEAKVKDIRRYKKPLRRMAPIFYK